MHRTALFASILLSASLPLSAYSVLSHEAIIDSAWDQSLKPLILQRFPRSTPDELTAAHGYAYGGCIIQDMGYYPLGSKFFSDLVHYVRSGDFVFNLLRESKTREEYAFALGALAHYAADTQGHSIAVNHAVAIEYPKLRRKYGDVITYYDKPSAHMRVEFGFDVMQVARHNYAPKSYHDFIGFQVSRPVLERAFRSTYSLELKDLFPDLDMAIGTYRFAVSSLIPNMTKVAWKQHQEELKKKNPALTRSEFVYNLSKASYHKDWGGKYKKPGIQFRVLSFVIQVVPKVGPLKSLAFHPPSPEADGLFQTSFNKTLEDYRGFLQQHRAGRLKLENRDFDTGALTQPGEYPMCDEAYAKLAVKLADKNPTAVDPQVRREVLAFFSNLDLPYAMKKDKKQWQTTLAAVQKLRSPAMASMPY